jgi:hypothetical protein
MPVLNIEDNIKQMQDKIISLNQEIFRLQGALQIMLDFRKGGLTIIDIPKDPNQNEDVEPVPVDINTQENPE